MGRSSADVVKLTKELAALKQRMKKEKRRWRRELEDLESELREEKKRRRRAEKKVNDFLDEDDLCVADIVRAIGRDGLFTDIRNSKSKLLWRQAHPVLQRLCRDVLDEAAYKMSKGEAIPKINSETVKVRDGKAFIPTGPGRQNHVQRFRDFVVSVFGEPHRNHVYKDFIHKLSAPGLSLKQLQNLYFHKFLQSRASITVFPCFALDHLRQIKKVTYNNRRGKWTDAYKRWCVDNGEEVIDLEKTVDRDESARRTFEHRRKGYKEDPIDEADLVRNFITHFNENRASACNKADMGEVVFDLFPRIGLNLYDFLYECGIYMDFLECRTFYEENKPDNF